MIINLKKGMAKKEINSLLKRHSKTSKKKIDLKKYCGQILLEEDPLLIQKKLRDEWK
ncbi:MAG TPA: hypothetical protein PK559_07785 [Ignavibacteriaceae bacterium]|nr:hypothetical protein [Ignavibacteriaceae bacterium]